MPARNSRFDYGGRVKRRQRVRVIVSVGVGVLVIAGFALFMGRESVLGNGRRDLARLWHEGQTVAIFEASERELEKKPMDFFLLMVHGFSAYQIAIAQVNSFDMVSYIDRSIWALRKALLTPQGATDARIKYALGRAYYYKGPSYADLCIRYLEEARASSYQAQDIPQFLGLAYASIHDYGNSVAAFSEALGAEEEANGPSDILLLAIARSYMGLGEGAAARPYVIRAIEATKDWNTTAQARLILATLMMEEGDIGGAETQIRTVLSEGGENAEAHFQLGVLYNMRNDYYRARAEWRKAYNLDPNFVPVREKLNLQ